MLVFANILIGKFIFFFDLDSVVVIVLREVPYGLVALAIFFFYIGLSIGLYTGGAVADVVLLLAGLMISIGSWTLIYAFLVRRDFVFWLVNGSLLTLFSLSLFTYRLTGSSGYAAAVLFAGLGLIVLAYVIRRVYAA